MAQKLDQGGTTPTVGAAPSRGPGSGPVPGANSFTEGQAKSRIESQGYRVERITPQNNGSWKAETSRDAVPTRPQGEPSKVTIYPDGRIVEEREPLTVNPPRP